MALNFSCLAACLAKDNSCCFLTNYFVLGLFHQPAQSTNLFLSLSIIKLGFSYPDAHLGHWAVTSFSMQFSLLNPTTIYQGSALSLSNSQGEGAIVSIVIILKIFTTLFGISNLKFVWFKKIPLQYSTNYVLRYTKEVLSPILLSIF